MITTISEQRLRHLKLKCVTEVAKFSFYFHPPVKLWQWTRKKNGERKSSQIYHRKLLSVALELLLSFLFRFNVLFSSSTFRKCFPRGVLLLLKFRHSNDCHGKYRKRPTMVQFVFNNEAVFRKKTAFVGMLCVENKRRKCRAVWKHLDG